MSGATNLQDHALSVIRAHGGVVHIVPGGANPVRCGWHHCSFSARTVRAMAAKGVLVREKSSIEAYRIAPAQEAADAPRQS